MFKRKTKGEFAFDIINNIFMFFIIIAMVYPFLNQIAISLSDNTSVISGRVSLWPKGFNLDAYRKLILDKRFFIAMRNNLVYTVMNTIFSMIIMTVYAYPLSKKHLKGRQALMTIMVFSMMFGTGGLIPNYLVVKNLGLVDNYWGLILPSAFNIWNIIILKNFFQQLPGEIEESALIDGASNMKIFVQIILPLSLPSIAAITLFTAVAAWNTFFNALIYINDPNKKLLQVYLNDILQANTTPTETANSTMMSSDVAAKNIINSDTLKAATLMCATLPILCVYPFVQKYFMAGLMVGSVKG
mgnify:FL=1